MTDFTDNPRCAHRDAAFSDAVITDFSDPVFQAAFREYFAELGISVSDWAGLFEEMDQEGGNEAILRRSSEGEIIGFIQYKPIEFQSWFFTETCGFIREFWIAERFRRLGHGSQLLKKAETNMLDKGIHTLLLTTYTAAGFYEVHGYVKAPSCKAKNGDDVFVKRIN